MVPSRDADPWHFWSAPAPAPAPMLKSPYEPWPTIRFSKMSNIKIYLLLTWHWVWMLLWMSTFKICHPLSCNVSADTGEVTTPRDCAVAFRSWSRPVFDGSGSGSGSEQTVSAAPAPAPAPTKMCRLRRLRLRIPGSIPCQSCPICYPSKFFLARIKGLQYFIIGGSFTGQQLYSRHYI